MDQSNNRVEKSLRQKIKLIFTVLSILILGVLAAAEIQAARASVREEIAGANRIATQLLGRITWMYADGGLDHLAGFLKETGRIRANDLTLSDATGKVLYRSPPATYKAGRDAPRWYAAIVSANLPTQTILLRGGKLEIAPNQTRAVLDAWDNLIQVVLGEALLLACADLLVFWIVGRWLAPFARIADALRAMERGGQQTRLPPLPGREAGEIGRAFNRMAQAVEESMDARRDSAEATARLAAQREFTVLLHQRIEEERAALARELHDELGQSLTAIRSIAKSLTQHPDVQGRASERAAQMLFDTAGHTADALARMIPRLRPLQLEGMNLVDALHDLAADTRVSKPELRIELACDGTLPPLSQALESACYRIAQEALTNVVRHAGASLVRVRLSMDAGTLRLTVSDDGVGAQGTLQRAGHFGVRGMRERAESLGGSIVFRPSPAQGLEVEVILPLQRLAA